MEKSKQHGRAECGSCHRTRCSRHGNDHAHPQLTPPPVGNSLLRQSVYGPGSWTNGRPFFAIDNAVQSPFASRPRANEWSPRKARVPSFRSRSAPTLTVPNLAGPNGAETQGPTRCTVAPHRAAFAGPSRGETAADRLYLASARARSRRWLAHNTRRPTVSARGRPRRVGNGEVASGAARVALRSL